jgi:hypothetical protein
MLELWCGDNVMVGHTKTVPEHMPPVKEIPGYVREVSVKLGKLFEKNMWLNCEINKKVQLISEFREAKIVNLSSTYNFDVQRE